MNVLRVHLRNFRSYAALDLELPDGATALIGRNGAGKSSILAAIDVALFGATSLEPFLRHGQSKLEVTVEVEHGGERYRVRRELAGGRSSLDFLHRVGVNEEVFAPLSHETQKATQKLIEGTLGLTRETFRASAYLAQGDAGAITNARPAERMAILRDTIGGLELYDDAHVYVKRLLADAKDELGELAGRSALLAEAVAELPGVRENEESLARDVEALELERDVAEAQRVAESKELAAARERLAELRELQAQHDAAKETLARLENEGRAANLASEQLEADEKRLPELEAEAALEGERDTLVRTLARHARIIAQQQELFGRASDLEREAAEELDQARHAEEAGAGASRCRECGQLLDAEALHASLATRRAHADFLKMSAAAVIEQANALEPPGVIGETSYSEALAALTAARSAREQAAELRGRIAALRAQTPFVGLADALERTRAELIELGDARTALTLTVTEGTRGPERRLAELNLRRSNLDQRLTALRRSHAGTEERRRLLEEQGARLVANEEKRKLLARETHVLELTAEMFAPTGIPLLVIENAIPVIEARAQEVLERLGGETAGCLLELRTQRANKGDGQLRDTLDILIHAPSGETLPYEHWSGGEKMRLDLALRVGLAQLLLAQGANVELFAVDEPDGLDAQGRAALAEVVEEMGERYGFRKILLISHDESLRDSFAQTLEVVRQDGGTSEVAA